MKKQSLKISSLVVLLVVFTLLAAFTSPVDGDLPSGTDPGIPSNEQVLSILDTKCNVCHRRQNPFMVFKTNNIEKRAPRIYQAVFVSKRMPKGNEVRLTEQEYATLEQWLQSKIN